MIIDSKLPNVGTTIFSVMSKLATECGAINLSQGFPNFPVDEKLTQIVEKIAHESIHQYQPMQGNSGLLTQIGKTIQQSYQRTINIEQELLITAGATQGIYTAIQALVKQNEEVIIIDPCYDCYEPAILLAGAKPVHVQMNSDFTIDWNKIEAACSSQTKLLIVNNPHNPSGKILKEADLMALETILEKFPQLILLSDEVYEYITFEQKHISANTRSKLINRSVIVSSFGKTFHITGWKIGYLVAPAELMIEIKKVHQFLVFSVNSISQFALAAYMQETDVQTLGQFYQQKRDLFRHLIQNSRFKLLESEGTYFQVASFASISEESDLDFTKRLTTEHGVATIPMSVFNANGKDDRLIRFCFAKDENTLIQAAERICKI